MDVSEVSFSNRSYLSQVRLLREVCSQALSSYPFKVRSVDFLNHGENTTFKVTAKNGQIFLLRVHRKGYHTQASIDEELAWLSFLNKAGIAVPRPILSSRGENLVSVDHPTVDGVRFCTLLKWVDGRFVDRSVNPGHLYKLGRLLGQIQRVSTGRRVQHRPQWTANGLVGRKALFGGLEELPQMTVKENQELLKGRKIIYQRLTDFERSHPERMGLLHSDLHFGNVVFRENEPHAIDFDDCGYGSHIYDLAIPYLSAKSCLGKDRQMRLPDLKRALFEGYAQEMPWNKKCEMIFEDYVLARNLSMVGWLRTRSDNPKIAQHLVGAAKRCLEQVRTHLG